MLSSSGKKVLLGIHILLIAVWLGTVISAIFLLLLKSSAFDTTRIAAVDKAVFYIFDLFIMNVSIAVAISGLLFSMFTRWGFFKFYWITTKWVILVILAIIIVFFAGPAINGMAALSDVLNEQVINDATYSEYASDAVLYFVIQLLLLILIVFISVIKPWGQRKTRREINRKLVVTTGIIFAIALSASAINQYVQLVHYRNLPINEVDLLSIADGYYVGTVVFNFKYEVGIDIKDHAIKDIKFLNNRNSYYARLAEGIKHKIIREQKINIDSVTGATTTSKIFLKAIEVALYHKQKRE